MRLAEIVGENVSSDAKPFGDNSLFENLVRNIAADSSWSMFCVPVDIISHSVVSDKVGGNESLKTNDEEEENIHFFVVSESFVVTLLSWPLY